MEQCTNELRDSRGALFQWFERQIPRMPPKAYRWVGEMEEIAHTFVDLGLPPQMVEGTAALYRLVGQTELGVETPEKRHLGQTLEEGVDILAFALAERNRSPVTMSCRTLAIAFSQEKLTPTTWRLSSHQGPISLPFVLLWSQKEARCRVAEVPDAPLSSQQLPGVFMLAQSGSGALPYAPDGQEGP